MSAPATGWRRDGVVMTKCPLCGRRRAKRYCPAKAETICSVCCGRKRLVEIDCPADCQYLVEGERYRQEKVVRGRIRREGVRSYVRRAELYNLHPELFTLIEGVMAEYAWVKGEGLSNRDLDKALEAAAKTVATEESGLIYRHSSENPVADELSARLLEAIGKLKAAGRLRPPSLPPSVSTGEFVRSVLDEYRAEIRYFDQRDVDPASYVLYLKRIHPERRPGGERPPGGIIVPAS